MPDPFAQYAAGAKDDPFAAFVKPEAPATPQPLIGHPLHVSDETPTAKDRLINGFVDNPLIQGAAHPQTLGDFASLLLPQTPESVARIVAPAVKPAIRGAIRTAAWVGDEVNPKIIGMISPKWGNRIRYAQEARDAMDKVAEAAPATIARSTDSTARVLEPVAEAAPEAVARPVDMNAPHLDRSVPMRPSEMTQQQIAERMQFGHGTPVKTTGRIVTRQPIEPMPSHVVSPEMVPVGEEAAYNAAHAAPQPVAQGEARLLPQDQVRRDLMDPEIVKKATEMQQNAQGARLSRPRMEVGAEKVGRAEGMTTDEVRQQAGPVLGEARGEASPVFPQGPFDRMADTLKAMRPEDRLAYVMKAGDVKTQAQLETIRRVMAKYGLVIPAAATVAPSVRDMLLQQMRSGVTGRGTAQ